MLRIKPTDDCIIQKLNCTTGDWEDWFSANCAEEDLTAPMRVSVRNAIGESYGILPPDAPTEPPNAECATYDIFVPGNGQAIIPARIAAGDTITVTATRGIVIYDPGLVGLLYSWSGPEGINRTADGSFPLPGIREQRLIMNINGIWHDAYLVDGFTVPEGVDQPFFTMSVNDDDLSNNSGGWSVTVQVCNNHADIWTKVFDFTENDGGFSSSGLYGDTWTDGEGWGGTNSGHGQTIIHRTIPGDCHIIYAEGTMSTDGTHDHDCDGSYKAFGITIHTTPFFTATCNVEAPGLTDYASIELDVTAGQYIKMEGYSTSSTYFKMRRLKLQGTGTEPDWGA